MLEITQASNYRKAICLHFFNSNKNLFSWFLKGYGTACSVSKIFYPHSVAVAMLVFQARLLGEEEKKHFFSLGRSLKTHASPRPPRWPWLQSPRNSNLAQWKDPRHGPKDASSPASSDTVHHSSVCLLAQEDG